MDQNDQRRLGELLDDLSKTSFQENIAPKIVKDPYTNATARIHLNTIELSEWMLTFSDLELKAILAHEVGHIALKTIAIPELIGRLLPTTIKGLITLIVFVFGFCGLAVLFDWSFFEILLLLVNQTIIYAFIMFKNLSSLRGELNADFLSALLINDPQICFSALKRFTEESGKISPSNLNKSRQSIFIMKFSPISLIKRYMWRKELEQREKQLQRLIANKQRS